MTRFTKVDDRGSVSVELAVLTPLILVLLATVIAGARIVTAHAGLDHATTAAARAASLARSPGSAHSAATATVHGVLAQQGLRCRGQNLAVDTSGLTTTPGSPASVTARTRCHVALADLTVPGLPGSVPLSAEFSSPVDPYRERALGSRDSGLSPVVSPSYGSHASTPPRPEDRGFHRSERR